MDLLIGMIVFFGIFLALSIKKVVETIPNETKEERNQIDYLFTVDGYSSSYNAYHIYKVEKDTRLDSTTDYNPKVFN